MTKPTPIQAKALKGMAEKADEQWRYPRLDLWMDNDGNIKSVRNRYTNPKVRLGTARVLLREGWIEKKNLDSEYSDYVISEQGKNILELLSESDFENNSKKPIWTTRDILDALIEKYRKFNDAGYTDAPKWIFFPELGNHNFASRRIDLWAMACWRSLDYIRRSYEIKISRGDFLNEMKHPEKREFALKISNEYYFVTPPGLIKVDELPEECGLIELSKKGNLVTKKKAPRRNPDFDFTWGFASMLGRKIFKKMIYETTGERKYN